ncbi:MAG: c-type cytochrome biogenesis protein CcsB [Candidatus Velthaea sp.]
MDPTKELLDQTLLKIGLAAYITGTIVFIIFFLTRAKIWRQIGMPLAAIGCLAQFAELGARWNMTGVWPLTNLYGSLSLFSAMAVLIFIAFALKYDLWLIGGGVLGIAAISFGYATTWNEGTMPAVPALQSYWIKVHVPLVISAYASFMVAFVVSLLFIIKAAFEQWFTLVPARGVAAHASTGAGVELNLAGAYAAAPAVRGPIKSDTPMLDGAAARGDFWALWMAGLPSLSKLDILAYRIIAVGLPLLTVGIITGAWWAKEAWGAYWQWDPKETAALCSWIVYAIYMHLHTRAQWRGLRSAWINVLGFATIVFCYLGVNIFISGLHSYKM